MLKVGLAQIKPIWLNKVKTLDKTIDYINMAAGNNCDLVIFGEATVPGYPFWLELTHGAAFNDDRQKKIFAHYASESIIMNDLKPIQETCRHRGISTYVGIIEREGHSLFCSLVYIDKLGSIGSIHRKLRPTYDERLVWSPGDGHGLRTHRLEEFTVGGLNCWENWMPLARTSLYSQGENLHIMVWPGSLRNTHDITPIIAKESRSFVISVGCIYTKDSITDDIPYAEEIHKNAPDFITDGGSCAAAPDGSWLLEPQTKNEHLFAIELDLQKVLEERQNFDATGHYSRPDVFDLRVDRRRKAGIKFED